MRHPFPRRWPMLKLTDVLIARLPSPKKKKGVLILRMFGIGDALLFRAVLEKYVEALNVSLADVTVLGSTAWGSTAELFFRDVKVELIDERRFARNFFYRLKIMRNLRRRGFKTAICGMRLRYPHVIESLMLVSGADTRIVAQARPNEKFDAMFAHYAPMMTKIIPLPESEKPRGKDGKPLPLMHEITHQLAFLSAVAGRPIKLNALPKLTMPHGSLRLARVGERYAVLNIGASHAPRRWPLPSFFEVARHLLVQGWSVVFLGGPAEQEIKSQITNFAMHEGKALPGVRVIDAINEVDLAAAARLVESAALVISNDSGLGHLAIMMQRPSVMILGGGHFGTFMPYPPDLAPANLRVLYHAMPCYHCNWNCTMMPEGGVTFPCVAGVTAAQVWQAVTEIEPP